MSKYIGEKALKLRKQGLSYKAIGEKIGIAESTARKWCNPHLLEHFRAQRRKYREKGKAKWAIRRKEYENLPEVKEHNYRRSRERKMQKKIAQGYKVHPDGYLLDIKCDGCGELFDTKRRGQNGLAVSKTMYCTKECRIKVQIRKSVAAKRQRQNPNCKGGLRKFNCPHCGDKIETYRANLKYCGKDECKAIQQRIYGANYRGEWVEVKKGECRNCKKPFTAKVRKCKTDGRDRDHIKATAHIKYCSRKCAAKYGRDYLTDAYIKERIRTSFKKVEGTIISDDQISPQMVEDKRLLLKLNRAWKTKTGKYHPSNYTGRWGK